MVTESNKCKMQLFSSKVPGAYNLSFLSICSYNM